jgi:uncharacterized protein DUF6970
MTLRIPALVLIGALSTACAKESLVPRARVDDVPLPGWLTAMIDQFEDPSLANPPAFIARYTYQNQVVYYVAPRCCDIWSTLYTSTGAVLCAPDGGLSGEGDGRCPDFAARRRDELIVWQSRRVTAAPPS